MPIISTSGPQLISSLNSPHYLYPQECTNKGNESRNIVYISDLCLTRCGHFLWRFEHLSWQRNKNLGYFRISDTNSVFVFACLMTIRRHVLLEVRCGSDIFTFQTKSHTQFQAELHSRCGWYIKANKFRVDFSQIEEVPTDIRCIYILVLSTWYVLPLVLLFVGIFQFFLTILLVLIGVYRYSSDQSPLEPTRRNKRLILRSGTPTSQ